ncbi:PH domain-containing protein [Chitinophaga sp. 30R24]|uniref:PH domain-containing protein n=1 Tax=Chitinophaga sp. 30R24 TaxID=3248838 RepID=UPI003B90B7D2
MRYAAVLDDNSKIVTNLIIILTLVFLCRQMTDITHDAISTTVLLFVMIPVILVAWCLSPRYYFVTETAILIRRPFMSITIELGEVIRLKSITEEDLGNSSRLLAFGGIFGYLGTYHSSEIGKYQRWCTNRENLVLIESETTKWLISPSDADDFVRNVNKRINVPGF